MKRVISVSLGSSRGDKTVRARLLEHEFEIGRRAVPGLEAGMGLIRELDGRVDAIGLGGIDRYLYAGQTRYTIRDGDRMARCANQTPVVDGSGVKNTVERETIRWVQERGLVDFTRSRVLLVCAVDRFGMAEALAGAAREIVFGDVMFSLGVPLPLRTHGQVVALGKVLLPVITRLPFTWFYPTGAAQEQVIPRHDRWFRWADVIAGDSKYIFRHLPTVESGALAGKTLITQTLTQDEMTALRRRRVRRVITPTREFDGRTFATNVLEGVLVTLAGKRPESMLPEDYVHWLQRLDWSPTVHELAGSPE